MNTEPVDTPDPNRDFKTVRPFSILHSLTVNFVDADGSFIFISNNVLK